MAIGLCVIEWGEIIKSILPENTIFINFLRNSDNENTRTIIIEGANF